MNLNTYSNPVLRIGDKEITYFSKVDINFPGNSQINSLKVSGLHRDLANAKLLNKFVVFYLNEGSYDSVPIFRGFVRSVTPSDKGVSIKALDPRCIIAGKEALPIIVDDNENYDGMTISQFIYHYITTHVNVNETLIGTDMLNSSSISLLMRDYRTDLAAPYQVMQDALKQNIDDSDIENPKDYEFVMVEDGNASNIMIQEKQILEGATPSLTYDLFDGIKSIKYKKTNVPNYALVKGKDKIQTRVQDGNLPNGPISIAVKGDYDDRDTARMAGILEIMREQDQYKDISIDVTKGYQVGIGSIIHIHMNHNATDAYEISGNHRVVSKKISWSPKGTKMNLRLNRKPLKVSDFSI